MASVFTYDPNPPRVASPWANSPGLRPVEPGWQSTVLTLANLPCPNPSRLGDEAHGLQLEPEPQEGPVEYKLHLLLRPRRAMLTCSTGNRIFGSRQSRQQTCQLTLPLSDAASMPRKSASAMPTTQARQERLQQLTTQLLWRLQQSSPYHGPSAKGSDIARGGNRSIPGLDESRGALYEIGVSDDGRLMGLAKDEMEESLQTLKIMAKSLNCSIELLRTAIVGTCKWVETQHPSNKVNLQRSDDLWVVEALISPGTSANTTGRRILSPFALADRVFDDSARNQADSATVLANAHEQIRIAFTGGTGVGKTTLMGTLCTATLDTGRGSNRLSLLKHPHEIRSGVTSSVVPELIGYSSDLGSSTTRIINTATKEITSWIDIYHATADERLVFLIDAGGAPRYKRSLLKSLLSWEPHWTLCCVNADGANTDLNSATSQAGQAMERQRLAYEISMAHFDLCVQMKLRTCVVVTKMDGISRQALKATLSSILTRIKASGRYPVLLKPQSGLLSGQDDLHIDQSSEDEVLSAVRCMGAEAWKTVPVVLTSAVNGDGIGLLHALLRHLPLPSASSLVNTQTSPHALFQVDEVFCKANPPMENELAGSASHSSAIILSGHETSGCVSVGDLAFVGPIAAKSEEPHFLSNQRARSFPSKKSYLDENSKELPSSRRRRSAEFFGSQDDVDVDPEPTLPAAEWAPVQVTSLRNLRAPVQTLSRDQVGTIGIRPLDLTLMPRLLESVRRGMVLARSRHPTTLSAHSGFVALFSEQDYHVMEPGALFNIFTGSLRGRATIVTVAAAALPNMSFASDERPDSDTHTELTGSSDLLRGEHDLANEGQSSEASGSTRKLEVVFRLLGSREWLRVSAPVLIVPSNAVERSQGLDVFCGEIIAVED